MKHTLKTIAADPNRHRAFIEILVELNDVVDPDFLAQRIAQACFDAGALRPGEAIGIPSDPGQYITALEPAPARERENLIHHHPSPEVRAAAIRLLDALTSWERNTGLPNLVIIKDGFGCETRSLCNSPIPPDVSDQHALETFLELTE